MDRTTAPRALSLHELEELTEQRRKWVKNKPLARDEIQLQSTYARVADQGYSDMVDDIKALVSKCDDLASRMCIEAPMDFNPDVYEMDILDAALDLVYGPGVFRKWQHEMGIGE